MNCLFGTTKKRWLLLSLMLALLMPLLLGLYGCDDDDDDDNDDDDIDDDIGDDDDDDDTGDDDDDTGDDDTGDDDTGDDDTGDDDTGDDDTGDDDTGDDDTVPTWTEDWEDDTVGSPPGAPWETIFNYGATANILQLPKDGAGKVIELVDDSADANGQVKAELDDQYMTGEFVVAWEWLWESGEGNGFHLMVETGQDPAQVDFYGNHIEAWDQTTEDWIGCIASVDLDTWYSMEMYVNADHTTFDVYVDGVLGDCDDLGMIGAPITPFGVKMIMYSGLEGGTVLVDNIAVYPMM